MTPRRTAWAAWLVLVAAALAWAPFVPRDTPIEWSVGPPTKLIDIIGNLVLLAPLAAVLAVAPRRPRRGTRPFAIVAIVASVLEAAQIFIGGRVVSPFDPTLNLVGAAIAIHGTREAIRMGVAPRVFVQTCVGGVWASLFLVAGLTYFEARGALTLSGWDATFLVRAGDEIGGRRRYDGNVERAMLCAPRGVDSFCVEGGADAEARARLVRAAEQTQHVRVHATVTPRVDRQRGPARIITFSADTLRRNITLAQSGRSLVLRIRTPLTGRDAHNLEFWLPDAVRAGERTVVGAEFTGGEVVLTAQGPRGVKREPMNFGVLESWLLLRHFVGLDIAEPTILRVAAAAAAVVLCFPIGVVISMLERVPKQWLLTLAVLTPPAVLMLAERASIDTSRLLYVAVAGLLGYLFAVLARPLAAPSTGSVETVSTSGP